MQNKFKNISEWVTKQFKFTKRNKSKIGIQQNEKDVVDLKNYGRICDDGIISVILSTSSVTGNISPKNKPVTLIKPFNPSDNKAKKNNFFPKEISSLQKGTHVDFESNGTFYEAIGPVLVMGQCFGVMPVRGIKMESPIHLNFTWKSLRVLFSLLVFICTAIYMVFVVLKLMTGDIEFDKIVPVIFYGSVVYTRICFTRLAIKWPALMLRWEQIERKLPPFRGKLEKNKMAYKIKMISIIVISLSLTEHILNIISIVYYSNYCNPNATDPIRDYFYAEQSQIYSFISYSPFRAFIGKIINVMTTFLWSYMDLFVMLMSVGLSTQFKRINEHLMKFKGKSMPQSFWMENRINYRNMCDLCETVDSAISRITIVSFGNNLYFVCVQLLRSLNKMPSFAHAFYFWFSLIFLIARTLAVSLYSAEINDESKKPMLVFRSVPRESWCLEVKRFSDEVTNDVVALSGMKFFYITRKLVLSVAGTIVTYELVLIQFREEDNGADILCL